MQKPSQEDLILRRFASYALVARSTEVTMTSPVTIILGACGGKMLEHFFKGSRHDECCHLVPFLETDGRVCFSLTTRAFEPTKFLVHKHTMSASYGGPIASLDDTLRNTVFQTTEFCYPDSFLIYKASKLPNAFDLTGGYEVLPRLGNVEDSIKYFRAKFTFENSQWKITNIKNGGAKASEFELA